MADALLEILDGPVLNVVMAAFLIGLPLRFGAQLWAIGRASKDRKALDREVGPGLNILGLMAPLHRLIGARPGYSISRAVFHLVLIAVPVFYSGHVSLWEDSWLELELPALPDGWSDIATLGLIAATLYFILRRLALARLRTNSGPANYFLLMIIGAAFGSGYILAHGTLDHLEFFSNNGYLLHLICGELAILCSLFLVWTTRQNKTACIGCAACVESCPTGTLAFADTDGIREFTHSGAKCLACGRCTGLCPESAVELAHGFSLKPYRSNRTINTKSLTLCPDCGAFHMPESQKTTLGPKAIEAGLASEYLDLCARCRKLKSLKSHLTGALK